MAADHLIFIDNNNATDPRINLALEEFVVRNFSEGEYLLLYVNAPAVVLGKHQNALEEIDLPYASEHDIAVIRRISGGGAVYHDGGNLNFSVITDHVQSLHNNYQPFLAPVIDTLDKWGVESRLNNRNSLVLADGRKISGNAQFTSRGRMMSHGTLLFRSDLEMLNKVLLSREKPVESRAVASVRSLVANLSEVLPPETSFAEFRERILHGFAGEDVEVKALTDEQWREVHTLANEKYDRWEWNIGRSPQFVVQRDVSVGGENIPVRLRVVDGMIAEVSSAREGGVCSSEYSVLVGRRYDPVRIDAVLTIDVDDPEAHA